MPMTSMMNTPVTAPDRSTAIISAQAARVICPASRRHLMRGCPPRGPLPFPSGEPCDVTVGRGKGEPNIMVIYDGEIIGLMIPGTDTARRALALLTGAGAGHEHARSFGIKNVRSAA